MAKKDEQVTWYWQEIPGVTAGISRRIAGWMNVDVVDLERGKIGQVNRDKFFSSLGFNPGRVAVITGRKHSTNIRAVDLDSAGKVVYNEDGVDALSTNEGGLILAGTMADCLPLYFYEPKARVVGVAHAGWRGVLNNMAGKMVAHLRNTYPGIDLVSLQVLIGPCIRSCHFEVQSDLEAVFKDEYIDQIKYQDGKVFIDLPGVIKKQLAEAGVASGNINDSGECTHDLADKYFSFRRDKPDRVQSMVAFIRLNDE